MKKIKIIEFIIFILSAVGAILVAFKVGQGFFLFLISALLSIWFFYKSNMKSLLLQSIMFSIINLIAIYNWFIR